MWVFGDSRQLQPHIIIISALVSRPTYGIISSLDRRCVLMGRGILKQSPLYEVFSGRAAQHPQKDLKGIAAIF